MRYYHGLQMLPTFEASDCRQINLALQVATLILYRYYIYGFCIFVNSENSDVVIYNELAIMFPCISSLCAFLVGLWEYFKRF